MPSLFRTGSLALALVGAALLWQPSSLRAQDDDIFGRGNAKPAPAAKAEEPEGAKYIAFEVTADKKEVRRGETFRLTITGTPKGGYHTYPITRRSDSDAQPKSQLSRLIYQDSPDLKPLWPIRESPPDWVKVPDVGSLLEHKRRFTWEQDVLVLPEAPPGEHKLHFTISFVACDESRCLPRADKECELVVRVGNAAPVSLSPELEVRAKAEAPPIEVVPAPLTRGGAEPPSPKNVEPTKPGNVGAARPGAVSAPQKKDSSLWGLLLASMGAAMAMLFTPCVFPMVPITVSFFLKQSEKKHHNALVTAGVYSLTIIVVLALAVLVLGKVIVDLANSAWLNLGLGVVLIFFALSLFGMYEIELPNFLARFTASREGRGGYGGAFFMALTFTITSFTCTGPFLGPLLVATKELQLSFDRIVLAAFAYSATFAAPFFVMALFPSLLKRLPRSGGWLNSVKVVMGFLELAAALKFLGNTDIALNPGNPRLFTFEAVLCAWVALSAACGLYLFGVFRLPHDSPAENIGVPRMVLATVFLGLALYMVPALFRKVPQGLVGEGLYAFLPLDTSEPGGGGTATAETRLDWHLDYQAAWEQATKEGKAIFIDFTGVNCTNCRANENRVFPRKDVRDELTKFVRVQLYTDSVPISGLSSAEAAARAGRNSDLESKTFGEVSTPLYVVFVPDKTAPYEGDKLNGAEVDRRAGYIGNPADFAEFLKSARPKQVAQAAR